MCQVNQEGDFAVNGYYCLFHVVAMICPHVDDCPKIKMVLDKDLPGDTFYAAEIQAVCRVCNGESVS